MRLTMVGTGYVGLVTGVCLANTGNDVTCLDLDHAKIAKLEKEMPKVYAQLTKIYKKLEKHYRDMQDIEFTVEDGRLWMLQTRSGKRTGFAAIKIAVDMVEEKLIKKEEAIKRVPPSALEQVLRPVFDTKDHDQARKEGRYLCRGLNAGPGAASGIIAFHAEDAVALKKEGKNVILVRIETSPEDIAGMAAAEGILTARGGMTSHAAVVARQMGKTCVAGCGELEIDYKTAQMTVAGKVLKAGDFISLNGTTGGVFMGEIKTIPSEITRVLVDRKLKPEKSEIFQAYDKLMGWADEIRQLKVRTNADQPNQAREAIAFGAQGIGLCRTEHMFFGENKINHMRAMILSEDEAERRKHLKKLLPIQRRDFEGIFKAMNGYPVTVRTLDPPLHEFVPHEKEEIEAVAAEMGVKPADIVKKVEELAIG